MEDWTPSLDDVGAVLRARTVDDFGHELGTFNSGTRPTGDQVLTFVDTAVADVRSEAGKIPSKEQPLARRVAAIGAALQVELSFFPEEVATGQSPYAQLERMYEKLLARLVTAISTDNGNDDSDPTLLAVDSFGNDCGIVGFGTRF